MVYTVNLRGADRRDARASNCSTRPATRRPPRVGRAAHVPSKPSWPGPPPGAWRARASGQGAPS